MQIQENESGVVVVTAPTDWLFAKGCLASIRWFMPDIPLVLLIDGELDALAAEKTYQLQIIRKEDIPDPWLRQNSFGWGLTKMVAAWHAPFARFLYLDADTIVWGDLRKRILTGQEDVVWPVAQPVSGDPRAYVNTWFFNPKEIEARWPDFPWQDYVGAYACTGTFALRRGCLKLERYRELLDTGRSYPQLFHFGEMGILNLMVFEAVQAGLLKFKQSDFQVIFPDHAQDMLRQRFRFDDQGLPVINPGDEQVLHMTDKKPLVDNPDCYSEPMTFFRLKYLEDTEGVTGEEGMRRLQEEDAEYHQLRVQFLRRERSNKILGLLKGHPGEWRRLLGKFRRHG